MKRPVYVQTGSGRGDCCSICGCLVDNPDKHDSWHEALARLLGLDEED